MSEENTTDTTTVDESGLKKKNSELLGKLKDLQKQLDTLAADKEAAEEAAERKSGDLEALEKRLTAKFERELKAANERAEKADADLRTIRVDNAINSALAKADVVPEAMDALAALIKSKTVYEDGLASVDGKGVEEYVKSYMSGKQGQLFRRAPDNSGAGANGGEGSTGKAWTKEDIMGPRQVEFGKLARENPSEAKAIASGLGLDLGL